MNEASAAARLILVDDHPVFRMGLKALLEQSGQFEIVGTAASAEEAVDVVADVLSDLVVVDVALPGANGIELTKQLRAAHDDLPIVVMSMHDESLYAERALRAGATGYLPKHSPPDEVRAALARALSGDLVVSDALAARMVRKMARGEPVEGSSVDVLSDRELEVFTYIGQGLKTREIAERLGISRKTVEAHIARIKTKLDLPDGTRLVRRAVEWVVQEGSGG